MNLKERFSKAIELIIGNKPPDSFIDEWIDNETKYSYYRLQEWILNQENTPNWCQGIILIEAAMYIAENPIEGREWDIN